MASQLIELEDGILVAVDVAEDQLHQIYGGTPDRVDNAMSAVKPILLKVCKPLTEVWQELDKDMNIEEATVKIGLGFEAEGNDVSAFRLDNLRAYLSLSKKAVGCHSVHPMLDISIGCMESLPHCH